MGGYYSPLDLVLPLISLMLAIALALTVVFPASAYLIAIQTAILSTPFGYAMILANIGIYIAQLYVDWLD